MQLELIGGGFRFMFGTFCDIAADPEANEAAAAFIRSKIKATVKDSEKARVLTPARGRAHGSTGSPRAGSPAASC